jgi:acetolactate synthase-1/2/3 large subunit
VLIAVPADILTDEVEPQAVSRFTAAAPHRVRPSALTDDVAAEISALVAGAVRPVVIAGGGTRGARAELIDFAERYQVGVYTAFRRQDHFPNDHAHYLGHLGLSALGPALDSLANADLVILLGTRLSEITSQSYTMPPAGAKVIQIDIDAGSIGSVCPPLVGAVADVGEALRALARLRPGAIPVRDWSAGHAAYETWSNPGTVAPASAGRLDPAAVVQAMLDVTPANTIVANDAGNFSAFLHRYWHHREPDTQLAPTSGAMGYAVPAAIGGALARPDRPMLAVAGDGGFLMTGQELETAVRLGVAMTVVVFNNGLYGTIAMHQARASQRLAATTIGAVDVAGFARSLGAQGVRVDTAEALKSALDDALGNGAVNLVEVMIDPDRIAPNKRLSDMLA